MGKKLTGSVCLAIAIQSDVAYGPGVRADQTEVASAVGETRMFPFMEPNGYA